MSKHDYTELDTGIMLKVAQYGPAQFPSAPRRSLSTARLLDGADHEQLEVWRIVDRRLQALRKQGLIQFQRANKEECVAEGWVLVKQG